MDDMYEAAQCDATSLHAMTVLHELNYDTDKALKILVKTNQTAKMFEKMVAGRTHSLLDGQ
jgi:hypothetical protein